MTAKAKIAISTVYESLSSNAIDCAVFVVFVERGLRALPGFAVIEADATKELFFVHLDFDEIDSELRAVLGRPWISCRGRFAGTWCRPLFTSVHWTLHRRQRVRERPPSSLSLQEELKKRIEQDWLELWTFSLSHLSLVSLFAR